MYIKENNMFRIDIKSALIGFLGSCLLFILVAADEKVSSDATFGDITVNSITIKDDGHGGFITAYNQDQKRTLYLGTGKDANGYVQTYNKYEEPTAYIGSNRDMDGVIVLSDRYGALGYTQTGKK